MVAMPMWTVVMCDVSKRKAQGKAETTRTAAWTSARWSRRAARRSSSSRPHRARDASGCMRGDGPSRQRLVPKRFRKILVFQEKS
eukprot:5459139-Prymnesium_polylepis.1